MCLASLSLVSGAGGESFVTGSARASTLEHFSHAEDGA